MPYPFSSSSDTRAGREVNSAGAQLGKATGMIAATRPRPILLRTEGRVADSVGGGRMAACEEVGALARPRSPRGRSGHCDVPAR